MLTSRAGWFLTVVFLTLIIGALIIPYFSPAPAIVALALIAWFTFEWAVFQARMHDSVSRLRVSRRILQGGREVPMVWAGLTLVIRVTIENPGRFSIPFAYLEDRAAVATERIDGDSHRFTSIPAGGSVEIDYTLRVPSPGILRFEGVNARIADLQGFFVRRLFLREPVEYMVLPPLTDDEGRQRATKRFNTLPAPGIHRLLRPGSGSELLDLRDYRPGDPPKMIAWKPSARRDRLITKEFENDVPVRCVLFLDTSRGVRLGPPGNTLLTRLAGVAAVVAQAAAGNRDIVGLTTIDETAAAAIAPARTKIHMIRLLRRLAEVSSLHPGVAGVPPEQLSRRAASLAHELYPELMNKKVNSMTWGRLWIPLLDRKWGWIAALMVVIGFLLFSLGFWALIHRIFSPRSLVVEGDLPTQAWRLALRGARVWFVRSIDDAAWLTPKHIPGIGRLPVLLYLPCWIVMFVVSFFPPATIAVIFWFFHSVRGLFGERKREMTRRKQLSALFSLQDGAGVNGVERYIHDDDAFADRVARFLEHHQIRCPVPLYDADGRYRFRCAGKAQVLADAMIQAVGRARDNELYVILADLAELGPDLAPIVRACRVARSRHHHVLVIVPWPADVPSSDDSATETTRGEDDDDSIPVARVFDLPHRTPRSLKEEITAKIRDRTLSKIVRQNLTRQYHERFRLLRRQLSQFGTTVMRVNDGDPVQLVLDRLDRLRGMRSRR